MAAWMDVSILQQRIGDTTCPNVVLEAIATGVESTIEGLTQSPILQVQREGGYWLGGSGTTSVVLPERPIYLGDVTDLHVYVVSEARQTPTAEDEIVYLRDFDFEGDVDGISGYDYRWSGVMQRIDGNVWPCTYRRQVSRLSSAVGEWPRVIRVVGLNVGWLAEDIPGAILEAAYMEAAARFFMRKRGVGPMQSESWNGYSYSLGFAFLNGLEKYGAPRLVSPLATELLAPYISAGVAAMR